MAKREYKMPNVFKAAETAVYRESAAEDLLLFVRSQIGAEIERQVAAMGEDEREAAARWALGLSTTNCGWGEYKVGKRVLVEISKIRAALAPTTEAPDGDD